MPMNFGTFVYNNKIYNLEYMEKDEMKSILRIIESDKKDCFIKMKNDVISKRKIIGGYKFEK